MDGLARKGSWGGTRSALAVAHPRSPPAIPPTHPPLALTPQYLAYVAECFSGSSLFHKALKEAFEAFCNRPVGGAPAAELMATYCDALLRKGGAEKLGDDAVEEALEKVVRLLAYISEKRACFFTLSRGRGVGEGRGRGEGAARRHHSAATPPTPLPPPPPKTPLNPPGTCSPSTTASALRAACWAAAGRRAMTTSAACWPA